MDDSIDQSEQIKQIERGLDLLFTTEIAKNLLNSVDIQALHDGGGYDEAVDYEQLAETLGRTLGRGFGKQLLSRFSDDHLVVRFAGSTVAGRLSAIVVRELLHQTEPEEVMTWFSEVADEGSLDVGDDITIPLTVVEESDED
ncbi:hypothetical protein SAMN05421858_3029 [Haladaptatus litoreus]|uniref:Uncharacterized protein n=1 Tax=Haladaptatus litoreus TaxID=553468 RepID=A0A1N7CJ43_9EURY|nr:hypothetical protein [Haladaptatus litoreus]SIR63434.1 hypothetical protein SAMN05421858_3029 [Haladaptatus litoreus]